MVEIERRNFKTSRGHIPLWGFFGGHDASRPVLLVIRGAWAGAEDWTILASAFQQADVVFAHLPGMHSPFLRRSTIAEFGKAFDEVIERAFSGRCVAVFGLSMGGLVAMTLQSPPVLSVIACDPPLSTAGLWPLVGQMRGNLADPQTTPELRRWIAGLFGLTTAALENIDYRPILDALQLTADVIIAGVPLEPERRLNTQPGMMTKEDRAFAIAHPKVRAMVAPDAGHNVPRHTPWVVTAVVNRALYEITTGTRRIWP